MNITYLIGNGFDLNMGLNTKYTDFIKWLSAEKLSDYDSIKELQKSIDDYCKKKTTDTVINWSDTETALGLFTHSFKGRSYGDKEIDECHTYLCEKLSEYLQREEKRVPITQIIRNKSIIENVGSGMLNYTVGLTPVDANIIKNHVSEIGGRFYLRVIYFNYTSILDQLLQEVQKQGSLGIRMYRNTRFNMA